jgi:DNA-directed RNA polymerase subunit H (RpoH/RPB5)
MDNKISKEEIHLLYKELAIKHKQLTRILGFDNMKAEVNTSISKDAFEIKVKIPDKNIKDYLN